VLPRGPFCPVGGGGGLGAYSPFPVDGLAGVTGSWGSESTLSRRLSLLSAWCVGSEGSHHWYYGVLVHALGRRRAALSSSWPVVHRGDHFRVRVLGGGAVGVLRHARPSTVAALRPYHSGRHVLQLRLWRRRNRFFTLASHPSHPLFAARGRADDSSNESKFRNAAAVGGSYLRVTF